MSGDVSQPLCIISFEVASAFTNVRGKEERTQILSATFESLDSNGVGIPVFRASEIELSKNLREHEARESKAESLWSSGRVASTLHIPLQKTKQSAVVIPSAVEEKQASQAPVRNENIHGSDAVTE